MKTSGLSRSVVYLRNGKPTKKFCSIKFKSTKKGDEVRFTPFKGVCKNIKISMTNDKIILDCITAKPRIKKVARPVQKTEINISGNKKTQFMKIADIKYMMCRPNYVFVFCEGDKDYTSNRSATALYKELPMDEFFKVRSFIVRIKSVTLKGKGRNAYLIIDDKTKIKLPEKKIKAFLKAQQNLIYVFR